MGIELFAVIVAAIFLAFLFTYSQRLHKTPDPVIVTNKKEADFWPGKPSNGKFTDKDKQTVYEDSKGRCMYCNVKVTLGEPDTRGEMFMAAVKGEAEGQFEHIVPANLGGSNEIDNRALACEQCNIARSTKPTKEMIEWLRTRGKKIYYGKRVELWNNAKNKTPKLPRLSWWRNKSY